MRAITLTFFTITLFFTSLSAHALDGIPSSFTVGDTKLALNGAGSRTKFIVTVYNAGLYLKTKSADANKIVAANEPMAIRLKIKSGFATKDKIKSALLDGFKNSTGGNTKPIHSHINQLMATAFKDEISKGDVYDLVYTPGGGTQVLKNAKRMTVLRGFAFKKALFGIWLSSKPAQASLKSEMLGK